MSNQDYRHLISQASYSIPPEDVPLLKDQKLAITVSKSEQQIADINQLTPADGASNCKSVNYLKNCRRVLTNTI